MPADFRLDERIGGGNMARLSYENDQGGKFEILEGSHVYVQGDKGETFLWESESATPLQKELEQTLATVDKILKRPTDLSESRPFLTDGA
jgi:hypothetical protein